MGKTGRPSVKATDSRRIAVFELWRQGVALTVIAKMLAKDHDSPSRRTITNDVAIFKKTMISMAQDLLGNQDEAVADFVSKSLDTRNRCLDIGTQKALALVHQIDKDLLKLCGVNLDRVEVGLFLGKNDPTRNETFPEMMNRIREGKALKELGKDEL